jgi:hypothetical protein
MRTRWAAFMAAATLALVPNVSACSEGGDDEAAALCNKWDTLDAELEDQTLTARDRAAELAALLPDAFKRDAALYYYPGAGDPGPDADGTMAEAAGHRLREYRDQVCGHPD